MKLDTIKIGSGLNDVKFGISREKLRTMLGEPDEIEIITPGEGEEEEEGNLEAWHYDELEISATFDELEDWRLTSLAVSSPAYLFEGMGLVGLTREDAIQQVDLMGLGEIEMESVVDEDGNEQEVGSIPEINLNFWFEDGQLSEIQWGPIWDEDEENFIWPA